MAEEGTIQRRGRRLGDTIEQGAVRLLELRESQAIGGQDGRGTPALRYRRELGIDFGLCFRVKLRACRGRSSHIRLPGNCSRMAGRVMSHHPARQL